LLWRQRPDPQKNRRFAILAGRSDVAVLAALAAWSPLSPLAGVSVRGAILRLSGCAGQDRPQTHDLSSGDLEPGDLVRDLAPIALFDGR
jgi:hypothetical protein